MPLARPAAAVFVALGCACTTSTPDAAPAPEDPVFAASPDASPGDTGDRSDGRAVDDACHARDASDASDAGEPSDSLDARDAGVTSTSCASLPLCDGFESASVGGPPAGTIWSVVHPDCSGSGALAIDDAIAHSGRNSLRIDGGGGYCDHVFAASTRAVADVAGADLWIRFFLRLDAPLADGHVTFLAMRDEADGGKDLRFGGQKGILMWNRSSDDATLPALGPIGVAASVAPTTKVWHCLEAHVDRALGRLETFVDGARIEALGVDGTPTPELDGPWIDARPSWLPAPSDLRLGWESYAGVARTLWLDDVATSATRLGCAL